MHMYINSFIYVWRNFNAFSNTSTDVMNHLRKSGRRWGKEKDQEECETAGAFNAVKKREKRITTCFSQSQALTRRRGEAENEDGFQGGLQAAGELKA